MKPVVLILAGGQSARFWPLFQKNLFPMMGKPLLYWKLKKVLQFGFEKIIVVGNKEVVIWGKQNCKSFENVEMNFIIQKNLPGMGGAVLSAEDFYQLRYKNRPLYILNANDFFDDTLHKDILESYKKEKGDVYIAGYKIRKYQPLGYLIVKKGQITEIVEKPSVDEIPSHFVNIVAHFFKNPNELFISLRKQQGKNPDDNYFYETTLNVLMKKRNFQMVPYQDRWEILKYPWHMLSVMDFFLQKIKKSKIAKDVEVSSKAKIGEKVVIEKGVRVFPGAKIVGPCWIGENTIVGDNSLVRKSMLGANCVIGFSSDITRSYLGDGSWTHNNYIGDSVLDRNVSLGSGTVTGNLRLDEKNIFSDVKGEKANTGRKKFGMIVGQGTRLGVNASFMPGIKIGQDCFVGPGVVLTKDLPDKKFCLAKQKLIIKENKFSNRTETRTEFKKKI